MTGAVPGGPTLVDEYLEMVSSSPAHTPGVVNSRFPSDIDLLRVNPEELERLSGLLDSVVEAIEDLAAGIGHGDSVVRFPGCLIAQVSTVVAQALNTATCATADRIAYMSGVAKGSAGDYRVADGVFAAKLAAVGNHR